jgi:hypothetical protein
MTDLYTPYERTVETEAAEGDIRQRVEIFHDCSVLSALAETSEVHTKAAYSSFPAYEIKLNAPTATEAADLMVDFILRVSRKSPSIIWRGGPPEMAIYPSGKCVVYARFEVH